MALITFKGISQNSSISRPLTDEGLVIEMEKRGYTFYIGKGPYASQNMFQIANMGEIYEQDCENMLEVFQIVLNKMQQK